MHVLINGLSARLGGGQTYLLNLLQRVPEANGWRVSFLALPSFPGVDLPANVTRLTASFRLENPIYRAAWERLWLGAIAERLQADALFCPGGLLPGGKLPRGIATAVAFRNMLPFDCAQRRKYPFGYRRLRDWILERKLSKAMKRADLVIFISDFIKSFIENRLGVLGGRSVVVPHGVGDLFRMNPGKPCLRPEFLPPGDYFLYVSRLEPYKAQLEVVRGFDAYRRGGGKGKLVLVGPEYPPYAERVRREIAGRGLEPELMVLGNLPHHELPPLYQHAAANIFASRIENCPNILLEMLAAGRPAVVSNRQPMPEFGGDAALYFNPDDPRSLSDALTSIERHADLREDLGRRAAERSKLYRWETTAQRTWEAIAALKS